MHYAKTMPYTNDDKLKPQYRPYFGGKAKELAKDKASYRRRERRVLNRMLAAEVEDEFALMELAEAEAANAAYIDECVSFWMDERIDACEEVEYLRRELAEAEFRLAEAEMMLDWWNEKEV